MNTATKILIDELINDNHPVSVSDLIYHALKDLSKKHKGTNLSATAYYISERILEAEVKKSVKLENEDIINKLIKNK